MVDFYFIRMSDDGDMASKDDVIMTVTPAEAEQERFAVKHKPTKTAKTKGIKTEEADRFGEVKPVEGADDYIRNDEKVRTVTGHVKANTFKFGQSESCFHNLCDFSI